MVCNKVKIITPKNKRVVAALETIGLTELKAQVYLYVLHYGPCGASRVYKGLEHDKSSTYRVLDELVEEGLLTRVGEGYGQEYRATDPNFVLQMAQSQREELSEAERDIFDLVRNLEQQSSQLYKQHHVRVYEGVSGVKDSWEGQIYAEEKIIREIGTTSILSPQMDDYREFMEKHAQKRAQEGIFLRSLAFKQDLDGFIDRSSEDLMREVRPLPEGFTLQAAVALYGSQVVFHYPKGSKIRGVVLEDEIVASLIKSLFDQLWRAAAEIEM